MLAGRSARGLVLVAPATGLARLSVCGVITRTLGFVTIACGLLPCFGANAFGARLGRNLLAAGRLCRRRGFAANGGEQAFPPTSLPRHPRSARPGPVPARLTPPRTPPPGPHTG